MPMNRVEKDYRFTAPDRRRAPARATPAVPAVASALRLGLPDAEHDHRHGT